MNPKPDAASRTHQLQAARRSQAAWSSEGFQARLPKAAETDLTGLMAPGPPVTLQIQMTRTPRFSLGRMSITPNAARAVPQAEVFQALARHAAGDWRRLDEHDRQENERALQHGGRVFSAYDASTGQKFWVITEANFTLTTVLLPEDY